jgi:hypothetical protein
MSLFNSPNSRSDPDFDLIQNILDKETIDIVDQGTTIVTSNRTADGPLTRESKKL